MPISASRIVNVTSRLIRAAGAGLQMNGLILVEDTDLLIPYPNVLKFSNAADVGNTFGIESSIYEQAVIYFNGFNNSTKKPDVLFVASRILAPRATFVRTARVIFSPLMLGTEKSITVTIGGVTGTFTVDTSTAQNLDDIYTAAYAAYSTYVTGKGFTPFAKVGANNDILVGIDYDMDNLTISFSSEDLGGLLGLQNGILSEGVDVALTATQEMERIKNVTEEFVTFTTSYDVEVVESLIDAQLFAKWANDSDANYMYIHHTIDKNIKTQSSTVTFPYHMIQNEYTGVAGVFGVESSRPEHKGSSGQHAAFIMGCFASVDWERASSVITGALKSQDGLPATINSNSDADRMLENKMNYYGRHVTRTEGFNFLYNGAMFGKWEFMDTYINAIWLKNRLQLALMVGLVNSNLTPYNEAGFNRIDNWASVAIEAAKKNGVIQTGIDLDAQQKAQVNQEIGRDVSMDLFTKGYIFDVTAPSPAVRQQRGTPNISFYYTDGGAIHKLNVPITTLT